MQRLSEAPSVGIQVADRSHAGRAIVLRANSALVETDARLPYGTRVTVVLPSSTAVEGIVRWKTERGVGIQFDRPRPRALHEILKLLTL
jgi:hypothetical protein